MKIQHDDENKILTLTQDVQLTNRVFVGCLSEASVGEAYKAEYSAPAVDDSGNTYTVYWQFIQTRGSETDPSNYSWGDTYRIVATPNG